MRDSSMILFGTLFSVLLIFSCITLNASRFYTEMETNSKLNIYLVAKPIMALRDRNSHRLSK